MKDLVRPFGYGDPFVGEKFVRATDIRMHSTSAHWMKAICLVFLAVSIHAVTHGQDVASVGDGAAIKRRAKAVVDANSPAIVRFAYGKEPKLRFGCGVIVDPSGHVAISGPVHAVLDDDLLDLRLVDGRHVRGKALGWSSEFGLGMLKIIDPGPWPHVEVSDNTQTGQVCVALGYPRNSGEHVEEMPPDVRLGLVAKSADGHWLTVSYRSQFNAHPVFDLNGKLLGLNCSTPVGGDPLHASAQLISAYWDDLIAGRNLDRRRLFAGKPAAGQSKVVEDVDDATAVANAKAACVRISDIGDTASLASGVIVTPEGYVITCGHHRRMPGQKLSLDLHDGRSTTATVLGTDLVSDIGVLKITDDGPWPHAEMGHSATMGQGERCVLIGYPRTKEGQEPWVFTTQMIKPTQTLARRDEWYCQFWTKKYPGSIGGASGGGVFDTQGRVIGVLLGGAGDEMQHSRVELFRKNWKTLTANKPVHAVEASLVADASKILGHISVELSARDQP
jgi:S1-C subfamily serine protease